MEDFSALHTLWEGTVALGWVSKPTWWCPSEPEAGVCHSHTAAGSAWLTPCPGPALRWGLGHSASELPARGAGTHTGVSVTRSYPGLSARLSAGLWLALPLPAG